MPDAKPETMRVEAEVERLGAGGDGVARVGETMVFVSGALPGERVEIDIPASGAVKRGVLVNVLRASHRRVTPPCPYFGTCGGCALQHVPADDLGRWKQDVVVAALRHRGIDGDVAETIQVPAGDRRRVAFRAEKKGGRVSLGFNRRASHAVIDIDDCILLVKPLNRLLTGLRGALHGLLAENGTARAHATLTQTGVDLDLDATTQADRGRLPAITAMIHDLDLGRLLWNAALIGQQHMPMVTIDRVPVPVPPRVFLQASRMGEAHLIRLVLEGVGDAKKVVDLFCGVGTFALPLSQNAQVRAFDSGREAIAALTRATRGVQGRQPITAAVRDLFRAPVTAEELAGIGAIVFDPPRAGAEAQARQIAASKVPVVVAVSCDPGTFARDARLLIDGGYRLDWVRPVDQFVWSPHVELVARFERS